MRVHGFREGRRGAEQAAHMSVPHRRLHVLCKGTCEIGLEVRSGLCISMTVEPRQCIKVTPGPASPCGEILSFMLWKI